MPDKETWSEIKADWKIIKEVKSFVMHVVLPHFRDISCLVVYTLATLNSPLTGDHHTFLGLSMVLSIVILICTKMLGTKNSLTWTGVRTWGWISTAFSRISLPSILLQSVHLGLLLIHDLRVVLWLLLQNLNLSRDLLRHLLDSMLGLHDSNLSLQHLLHLITSSLLVLLHRLLNSLGLTLNVHTWLNILHLGITELLLSIDFKLISFLLRNLDIFALWSVQKSE